MRSLFTGFSAARHGFRLLRENPRLIPFALIPAFTAVIVSALAFWLVYRYGLSGRIEGDTWWAALGAWILRVVEFLAALVTSCWLVLLLGFPLCDPLTSRAEVILGAKTTSAPFMEEVMRAIRSTAAMLAIGIAGSAVLFVVGFAFGLAFITVPFTKFVWMPFFVAFDMTDPSLSRRQLRFRQKLGVLLGHPVRTTSLGLVGVWMLAIPGLNFVGLPVAALAGVTHVRDLERERRLPAPS